MASSNALAAAAASGPSIDRAITLDSLDGRIVEYCYGSTKLTHLIELTQNLIVACEKDKDIIPLTTDILLLSGPIFNINDLIYKRFEILNNDRFFNPDQVVQSQLNTNSINFDLPENLTNYDTTRPLTIPDAKKNLKTLQLFRALSVNALSMYQERLRQALHERTGSRLPASNGKPVEFNQDKIKDLLNFEELDILKELTYQQKNESAKNEDEIRLIHNKIDLSCLKMMTSLIDKTLSKLQPFILALEKCKTKKQILALDHWEYSIHRILVLLLKLADLYAIIRKFGKRIYFLNFRNLKALSRHYKAIGENLTTLEVYFNQQRRTNLLLASIAKLTRQGARVQVRPESLLTLAKDAKVGFILVKEANDSLKDLYQCWSRSMTDFAKNHANSFSMNTLREKAKNDALKQRKQQNQLLLEERKQQKKKLEHLYTDPSKLKIEVENQAKLLKKLEDEARDRRTQQLEEDLATQSSPLELSRSSSNSTQSRSSSLTLHQSPPPVTLSRTPSVHQSPSPAKLSRTPSLQQTPSPAKLSRTPSLQRSLSNNKVSSLVQPPSRRGSLSTSSSRRSSIAQGSDQTPFYRTPVKVQSSNSSLKSSVASTSSMDSSNSTTSTSPPTNGSSQKPRITSTPLRRSASLQPSRPSVRSNAAAGAGAAFTNRKGLGAPQLKANSFQSTSTVFQQRLQAKQQEISNGSPLVLLPPVTAKPCSAKERLQKHMMDQSRNGNVNLRPMPDRPKIVYKSFAPKLTSPTSSNGSRNNSLTSRSPTSQLMVSPTDSKSNSRSSSIRSGTRSPIAGGVSSPTGYTSIEAELLKTRMNRSRSNSLQTEESAISTLSPSNSIDKSKLRGRSNSVSQAPALSITKIEEDKSFNEIDDKSALSSLSVVPSMDIAPLTDENTLGDISVTHEEVEIPKPVVKRVRFIGVPKYDASEDAPSPNRALKNFRKVVFRTSNGVEITRSKEKLLTSQEGLAFRAFNHLSNTTWEGFAASNPQEYQGPTMRALTRPLGSKRLSNIFKSR